MGAWTVNSGKLGQSSVTKIMFGGLNVLHTVVDHEYSFSPCFYFQACTGLENIDECIVRLQEHDWELMVSTQI